MKNPELQSILETLQNIKPESVAQRGGFSDIGERLHRGEFAQEDVHVLATKLRSKAMEQSRTQVQERSREGRGR